MSNSPDFDLGNGDCNFTTLGSRPFRARLDQITNMRHELVPTISEV